jgi:hypothetical protein
MHTKEINCRQVEIQLSSNLDFHYTANCAVAMCGNFQVDRENVILALRIEALYKTR